MPLVVLIIGVLWLVFAFRDAALAWMWDCSVCGVWALGIGVALVIVVAIVQTWREHGSAQRS